MSGRISNRALGLIFAALMLSLLLGAMFYRKLGDHLPIVDTPAPTTRTP